MTNTMQKKKNNNNKYITKSKFAKYLQTSNYKTCQNAMHTQ